MLYMGKLILQVAFVLIVVSACSNPRDGGTGDEELKGNSGNQPEITDTTIAVPDSAKGAGTTTGMPGVNTVTGDTMTRYLEHTTGFSGSGTEEQLDKNNNTGNNKDNRKR
jgi:hypothetical protein